jgi:RNA polymerase sigma factor (sigma-70 family)
MKHLSDPELLREYAESRAEAAFGELVRRHVDLVYSAAWRMVQDAHLAEDVTQGVFLALARNAGQLTARPVLSGWLHRTAQNLGSNVVRSEVRRRAREQEAAAMNHALGAEPEPAWEEIAAQLDEVMGDMNEADRDALLLRYFEHKSAREMAQTLGTTEVAAQKRVNRAVERLRELLARRGVTASAGGLGVLISANAVQAAPAGLALSITTLAGTGVATLAAVSAAKSLAMTTLQKTLIGTALAAAIGMGTYEAWQVSVLRAQISALQRHAAPQPAETALADLQDKVQAVETQKNLLADELTRARTEIKRLENEGEHAKRSAKLYEELVEQANAKDVNPTNAYPTPRHAWVGLGKLGRIAALSKVDQSDLSAEERAALAAARVSALADVPVLVKALKQYDDAETAGTGQASDDATLDGIACILYGALNLNEDQFNQVYDVMQKLWLEAKHEGLSKDTPAAEAGEATKRLMEQFKAETQPLLTAEQNKIFAQVVTQFQIEPGKWGYSASFGL